MIAVATLGDRVETQRLANKVNFLKAREEETKQQHQTQHYNALAQRYPGVDPITAEKIGDAFLDMMNSKDPDTAAKGLEGLKQTAPTPGLRALFDGISSANTPILNEFGDRLKAIQKLPNPQDRMKALQEAAIDARGEKQTGMDKGAEEAESKLFNMNKVKGYDTPEEAMKVSQEMVAKAGKGAALSATFEIGPENKYVPKVVPNQQVRANIQVNVAGPKAEAAEAGRRKAGSNAPGSFAQAAQEDKDFWFEQYESNKTMPPFAWRDAESRNAFTRGYAKYEKNKGNSGSDSAAAQAMFKARQMALQDVTKRKGLISTFVNRIDGQSNLVEKLAKKYNLTDPRFVNMGVNELAKFVGSGDLASLKLVITSLSNEVAKVESGSLGIAAVSIDQAKIMARIHDENLKVGELMKVVQAGKALGKTSMDAANKSQKDIEDEMRGKPSPKDQSGAPPGVITIDPSKAKKGW